jgi:hypothetical protein
LFANVRPQIKKGNIDMRSMTRKISLIILMIIGFTISVDSQTVVSSTNGYDVIITINPTSVYTYGNSCKWGYNFDISFDYNVSFSGHNIPQSLYTLQGTIETENYTLFFDLPNKADAGSDRTKVHAWTSNTDCSTVNLQSLKLKDIKIEIEGPGIPHQYIIISASTLPIELISFDGKRNQNSVNLSWVTATETNNDYFTIERSTNGVDYEFVAKVIGAGNSNQKLDYSFVDQYVTNEVKYYRIKQTDFDGTTVCFKPISISPIIGNDSKIEVYPNPNSTSIITFTGASPELYELTVLNTSGSVINVQQLTNHTISIPELTAGFYILQFKNIVTGEIQNVKYLQK